MRDPKRIDQVLRVLKVYWTLNPDLRLGQIISNLTPSRLRQDPFYLEDDELLENLKKALNEQQPYEPTKRLYADD